MKCVAQLAAFCVLATAVQAQQIASVDLTHPQAATKSAGTQALPKGCERLLPGVIGDGYVRPPNNEPREIVVEMVKLSNVDPGVGSEVQGEVQLRNDGKYSIQIPWSADPHIIEKGQDSNHLHWEEGRFTFIFPGMGYLESQTLTLYGSEFAPGSQLVIQPGEWVTAEVKFKLEPEYPIPGRVVREGESQLRVEWEQTATTWDVKNCAVGRGYFRYRNFYQQRNPEITVKVSSEHPVVP